MSGTVPTTGRYDSEDGRTAFSWSLPEWSELDRRLCGFGLHIASRKVVVTGWVGYFSSIKHAYCACGSRRWMWFENGWVEKDVTEPGGHLAWVEGHVRMQETFAEARKREREWSERHPCWGEPYKCISCGCSEDRPCVSHVGGRRWNA